MNFAQPNSFWFLLLLLIPIIIHLFQFRRYKKLLFSNLQFLEAVSITHKKSRKLKHLLILLSRLLFIAAFVICLAKPNLEANGVNKPVQLIVLDKTASMLNRAEGTVNSIVEELKQAIVSTMEAYPDLNPILIDDVGSDFDRYEALNINSSNTTIDLQAIASGKTKVNKVLIASDFQRNVIDKSKAFFQDTTQQFLLLPAYTQQPNNLIWDSLWVSQNGEEVTKQIKIAARMSQSKASLNVAFNVNERIGANQQLTLTPLNNEVFEFSVPQTIKGSNTIKLSSDDASVFDNDFYAIYHSQSAVKVLYLYNELSNPLIVNLFEGNDRFELINKSEANFNYQNLTDFNVIIQEVGESITATKVQALNNYVTEGNVLIAYPSEQLNKLEAFAGLGFSANKVSSAQSALNLEVIDYQNPFFKGVFDEEKKNLNMPAVKHQIDIKSGQPILRTVDGAVFLSKLANRGNVFLFSSPLSKSSNDFVNSPFLLPVFYKMTFSQQEDNFVKYYFLDQEVLDLQYMNIPKDAVVKLRKDTQEFIPDQRNAYKGMQLLLPKNELMPGFWNVLNAKTDSLYGKIALNFPPSESEELFYTEGELRRIFADQNNVEVLSSTDLSAFKAYVEESKNGFPLWKYFLVLALLCLLAEVLIIRFLK